MAEILIRKQGRAGRITLNRPEALNALTYSMLQAIDAALEIWRDDPGIDLILIDGAGDKAFAAGGDIVDLYRTGRAGDYAYGRRFWADEYRLNARIANYPKPYVAVMHGFTMGGGVGVSAHGSHRIVSDGTQLAMPECSIGLVPDVGGSRLLGRAQGRLGEYLGLTSARVGPADAIMTGFADFYIPALALEDLKERLSRTGDPRHIAAYATEPPAASPSSAVTPHREAIERCFARETVPQILDALDAEASDWAAGAARAIRRNCPLSLACALAMIRATRGMMRIEQALVQEYRFIWRCMEEGEFLEGIRAAVIDKDRSPQWAQPDLAAIGAADVAAMLAPLGDNELTF